MVSVKNHSTGLLFDRWSRIGPKPQNFWTRAGRACSELLRIIGMLKIFYPLTPKNIFRGVNIEISLCAASSKFTSTRFIGETCWDFHTPHPLSPS